MPDLKVFMLGAPRVTRSEGVVDLGRRKATAVLSYLLLTQQIVRREMVAAFFWPDHTAAQGRADLSRILSLLRKKMGNGWLYADRQTVGPDPDSALWVDVLEFRRLLSLAQSHYHAAGQVCENCLGELQAAVDLYQGDFLAGFTLAGSREFDDWQAWQTESLRQELAGTLDKLAQWQAQQGNYTASVRSAQRRLDLDPLHEAAQRQLMLLYVWAGERSAALRQYESCRRTLDLELGLPPEEETRVLYEAILAGQVPQSPHRTTAKPVHAPAPPAIPPQPTPFIGRQEELAQIKTLILDEPACRLLSLVGPGGMGKTRLAVEAAERLAKETGGAFPDGIRFVSLAAVIHPGEMLSAVAESLDLALRGDGKPQEQLFDFLRGRKMLLVLDNLEHLLALPDPPPAGMGETAVQLTGLLRAAPGVKLLVTSRERLNLQEEWVLAVPGLTIPPQDRLDEAALASYSATNLFLQRARRAQAGFILREGDGAQVIRICRLVGGMPLGIELAAAWLRLMSLAEIENQIERGPDFLGSPLRDLPQRHRSLRAVFEQSWAHLAAEEKTVFKKLSVFQGGFRIRAAGRVAGATLPVLAGLADKSLLRRTRDGRYEIQELLRQFAAQKLADDGREESRTRAHHAEFYAAFMDSQGHAFRGGDEQNALLLIEAEIDNVRAGWRWAAHQADHRLIERSLEGLALFHEIRGWYHEGINLLEEAGAALHQAPGKSKARQRVLAKLLARQASIHFALTRYRTATRLLEESLAILKRTKAREALGYPYRILGDVLNLQGFPAQAETLYRQSLSACETQRDRTGTAWASNRLGWAAIKMGQFTEAEEMLSNALSYFREVDHRRGLIWTLNDLGFLLRRQGNYQEAQRQHQESLRISEMIDFRDGIAWSLYELADALRDDGQYEAAQENLLRALAIYRELGSLDAALCLYRLGYLFVLRGNLQQAGPYLAESMAAYRQVGAKEGLIITQCYLGELALAAGDHKSAVAQFERSLALFRRISEDGNAWGMLRVLDGLSRTYLAAGSLDAGCTALLELVDRARQLSSLPSLMSGLVGLAFVLARQGRDRQAVDLLALPLHHAATRHESRQRAQQVLKELQGRLPAKTIQNQLHAGLTLTPWDIFEQQLKHFSKM